MLAVNSQILMHPWQVACLCNFSELAGQQSGEIFREEKTGDTSGGRESSTPVSPVHEVDMAKYNLSCKNYIKH